MSLKVFDLSCENGHVFEGWFNSADGFDEQLARGLLSCPVCRSQKITRRLSAPHLNLKFSGARAQKRGEREAEQVTTAPATERAAVAAPSGDQLSKLQAEVMRHMRQIVRHSEDVGADFAQEARRIHEGRVEGRAIRGTASLGECRELAEDGISVMPIPEFIDDDRLH